MTHQPQPHVRLDFADPLIPAGGARLADVVRVAQAWDVGHVPACLAQVQEACAQGLHAAGFLAYEAAPAMDPAMAVHPPQPGLPLAWFALGRRLAPCPPPLVEQDASWLADLAPELDATAYGADFGAVREQLRHGECYQANLSFALRGKAGHPASAYAALLRAQPPGFAALLAADGWAVASVSPELFVRRQGDTLLARPMKGTRPRAADPEEDARLRRELRASPKDRAENVMIVDLLRSDLGRLAVAGGVDVPGLFAVEAHPTVWQMTSTIRARLRPEVGLPQAMAALFPCGSVTGAPKVAAMGLIRRLERGPRGVYCGAVGYVAPGGDFAFNVAIRTLAVRGGEAEYRVGSGLVMDSRAGSEYAECLAKAEVLRRAAAEFCLLESLRLEPSGRYALLERHLGRLRAAAARLGFAWDGGAVENALGSVASAEVAQKVRLLVSRDGRAQAAAAPLDPCGLMRLGLAAAPVPAAEDPTWLRCKTTRRRAYDDALKAAPYADDVLLFTADGRPTESCFCNLALPANGRWLTPSADLPILPGCLRAELLERGKLDEAPADDPPTLARLRAAPALLLFNSVRGVAIFRPAGPDRWLRAGPWTFAPPGWALPDPEGQSTLPSARPLQ